MHAMLIYEARSFAQTFGLRTRTRIHSNVAAVAIFSFSSDWGASCTACSIDLQWIYTEGVSHISSSSLHFLLTASLELLLRTISSFWHIKEEFLWKERLTLHPITTIMGDKISPFSPLEKKNVAFAPARAVTSIWSQEYSQVVIGKAFCKFWPSTDASRLRDAIIHSSKIACSPTS